MSQRLFNRILKSNPAGVNFFNFVSIAVTATCTQIYYCVAMVQLHKKDFLKIERMSLVQPCMIMSFNDIITSKDHTVHNAN